MGASSLSDLFVQGSPLLPQVEMLESLLAISLLAETNCSSLILSGSMVGVWQGGSLGECCVLTQSHLLGKYLELLGGGNIGEECGSVMERGRRRRKF